MNANSISREEKISLQRDGKKTYIEFLRIAAAFLVIVNHTNSGIFLSRTPSPTWLCSLTYFFICKIAVPLFMFIMGALLLGKDDTPKRSAERLLHIFDTKETHLLILHWITGTSSPSLWSPHASMSA